jgi:hypothetical protein
VQFEFFRLRFHFRAVDPVTFPPADTANIVRGTLGCALRQAACRCGASAHVAGCAYARIFEPRALAGAGPSGFAEWPRPFVLRTRHLDGQAFLPTKPLSFDVHLFDLHDPGLAHFVAALSLLAEQGMGPGRRRAQLTSVDQLDTGDRVRGQVWDGRKLVTLDTPASVALKPDGAPAAALRIRFVTPTELKCGGSLTARPDFPALFGRIRDRLSTLGALYGAGPLDIDFAAMGRRAAAIELTRCDIRPARAQRRSSRTGQVHPLGGFVGETEYRGDLAEFLPYLRAARWTGVGRQTVWGKGEIEVAEISPELPVNATPASG